MNGKFNIIKYFGTMLIMVNNLIGKGKFNKTIAGKIVTVDSAYRCTVRLLDSTDPTDNRNGVVIPTYLTGVLIANDDVEILIRNNDYSSLRILDKKL